MQVQPATRNDARAIAHMLNEAIEDQYTTFETRFHTAGDIETWFDAQYPIVVVRAPRGAIAFAACFPYRNRPHYQTIAEAVVFVSRRERGQGAGVLAMQGLLDAATAHGLHKLVSWVLPENDATRRMCQRLGFREVGLYRNHARLAGVWKDVVILERLIPENIEPDNAAAPETPEINRETARPA